MLKSFQYRCFDEEARAKKKNVFGLNCTIYKGMSWEQGLRREWATEEQQICEIGKNRFAQKNKITIE